jgi:hypothetical protein
MQNPTNVHPDENLRRRINSFVSYCDNNNNARLNVKPVLIMEKNQVRQQVVDHYQSLPKSLSRQLTRIANHLSRSRHRLHRATIFLQFPQFLLYLKELL